MSWEEQALYCIALTVYSLLSLKPPAQFTLWYRRKKIVDTDTAHTQCLRVGGRTHA